MIDIRAWTPDGWRQRVADAVSVGSPTWQALRRLSSTSYGDLLAETWRDMMFDDSAETIIHTIDDLWPGVTDPNHLDLVASDEVTIVNDPSKTGLLSSGSGQSGLQLGQEILEDMSEADEEVDSTASMFDLPMSSLSSIDDLRVTLKLRHRLNVRFLGVGKETGKAYVEITRTGGDSIYLVNETVQLENPGDAMDEYAVSLIDSCYPVDELRDMVLHSLATGDEVILDVSMESPEGGIESKYYQASSCVWALDDVELAIALDVRMMRRAMDVMSKIDGSVDSAVGEMMSTGLFTSMLEAGSTWPMVSQIVAGCGLEPDYRVIGLGAFLTKDYVEEVQSDMVGDGDLEDDDEDVDVEAVPVDPNELVVLNRSNNDAQAAVVAFCLMTFSVVATTNEAAGWRVDPIADKPDDVYGVPLETQVKTLEERLSMTLDSTCTVEYLGRRVDDGRLVFARADDEGNLLGWFDREDE